METIIGILVGLLRLVPLILAFYIPALLGVVIWRERGEAYRLKAGLWFAIGFGTIVAVKLMISSSSALQVAQVFGLALVEMAIALSLAYLTVYKLAD